MSEWLDLGVGNIWNANLDRWVYPYKFHTKSPEWILLWANIIYKGSWKSSWLDFREGIRLSLSISAIVELGMYCMDILIWEIRMNLLKTYCIEPASESGWLRKDKCRPMLYPGLERCLYDMRMRDMIRNWRMNETSFILTTSMLFIFWSSICD